MVIMARKQDSKTTLRKCFLVKSVFFGRANFCIGQLKDKYSTNVIFSDLSVKAAVRKAQQKTGQHSQISVWFWNKEEKNYRTCSSFLRALCEKFKLQLI